jgi:hypothetical protein
MTIANKLNWKLAVGIPFFIFFTCFLITLSSAFKLHPTLFSNAIVIDLLVTAPLAYLFVIRKSAVSKLTATRVFVVGLLVAGWILNVHSTILLHGIKVWISPVVELSVIFFICRKFYAANKIAKATNKNRIDFLAHCRIVLFQITGNEKFGNMISSEISVLYYAFSGRKNKNVDYKSTFTSYKENGVVLILGMILFIFIIEASASHFIFSLWNKTAAWILTALSFYTCLQLFAHIKAIRARPLRINADSLEIHNGLAGDAYIQFDNIEKIELNTKLPLDKNAIKIALIKGLENHNVIIYLKQPIHVTKIFGIKKETATVLFFVDKPKDFLVAVNSGLASFQSPRTSASL